MAKQTGLLLAGAGLLAFAMTRKKKKKKSAQEDIYDYGEDIITPDVKPVPDEKQSKRPKGNPPCDGPPAPGGPPGACYDQAYWGDNTLNRMTNIRQHFADLGYNVEVGPWPMNKIGPKGTFEVTNKDGSIGKLGGNDDKPDSTVMRFQNEYNAVSRCKELSGLTGGLAPDGLVGYFTLAALRVAKEQAEAKGQHWTDILKTCANKGFTP